MNKNIFHLESNTYASVHRATNYDNDPVPPPVPQSTRSESLILSPTTPSNENRRLSYDINALFPWETENDSSRKPSVTPRTIHEPKHESPREDSFHDDPPIKPKPRTTLQPKSEDLYSIDRPIAAMDFNATIRQPKNDLHSVDWLTETSSPTKMPSIDNDVHQEETRSPTPGVIEDGYDDDDFEEQDSQ